MSNGCGCSCTGIADAAIPVVMLPPAADTGCDGRFAAMADGKLPAAVRIPAGDTATAVAKETWMGGVGVGVRDRGADAFDVICGFGVDGRLDGWLFVWLGCGVAGDGDGVVGGAARVDVRAVRAFALAGLL